VLVTDEFLGVVPLWGDTDSTEMNYMDTGLPHCQFVHHKSSMEWPGIESDHLQWDVSDLCYMICASV